MTHALRKLFIVVWSIYFVLCLLIPAEATSAEYIGWAYFLSFMYFVSTYCFDKFFFFPMIMSSGVKIRKFSTPVQDNVRFVNLLIVLVVVGIIGALYDRLLIQHINFNQNLRLIKTIMETNASNREGVSSIANVIYYIFFPLIYPSVYLLIVSFKRYRSKLLYVSIFVFLFSLALVASFLSASRMILISFNIVVLSGVCVVINKHNLQIKKIFNKKNVSFLLLALCITIGFCCYVFIDRSDMFAKTSNVQDINYTDATLKHLGGQLDDNGKEIQNKYLSSLILSWAYVVHNIWIFNGALSLDVREGYVSQVGIDTWSCKLIGYSCAVDKWAFSGKFLSLPGTFYYDFGVLGLLFSAFITGALISIFDFCTAKKMGLVSSGIQISIFFIIVFSPLIFAVNILYFPLILYSFILAKVLRVGCELIQFAVITSVRNDPLI